MEAGFVNIPTEEYVELLEAARELRFLLKIVTDKWEGHDKDVFDSHGYNFDAVEAEVRALVSEMVRKQQTGA